MGPQQIPVEQSQLFVDSFWTHVELAMTILVPILGALWVFFRGLVNHIKEDAVNFTAIKGSLDGIDIKLDAMWRDFIARNER